MVEAYLGLIRKLHGCVRERGGFTDMASSFICEKTEKKKEKR